MYDSYTYQGPPVQRYLMHKEMLPYTDHFHSYHETHSANWLYPFNHSITFLPSTKPILNHHHVDVRPDVKCTWHMMDVCNTMFDDDHDKSSCREGARDAHLLGAKRDSSSHSNIPAYQFGFNASFFSCPWAINT